ncbi:MAG: alpha/beta hydrolase family protein [Acidobacteriota bacterium]|nr:alpha/beta hydrolase family protein [Acidobacteriota bacterium]
MSVAAPPEPPGPPSGVPGFVSSVWRVARQVASDPRPRGILQAAPRTAAFLTRANARTAAGALDETVVPVRPSPGLAAQVLLDEVMIAAFRHPRLLPRAGDYETAARDLAEARAVLEAGGWLDDPAGYHGTPAAPDLVVHRHGQVPGMRYEHLAFPSAWEPRPGEPGRDRWLSYTANRTAHAWIARARAGSRSWVVCVHGFGMGSNPLLDLNAFRASQLVRAGLNVAVVVLPMHGKRSAGRALGEGFMSIDLVDSMHGIAQAAWDTRRLVAWLRREEGAEKVGVMGHSLGGHVVSLVAGIEPGLDCVIAGIPVVDLPDLYRRHSPPAIARRAEHHAVLGAPADAVHKVVSPLALDCLVPPDGRFIFAGLGDRMATFGHAHRLWMHWGRPRLATYEGGHVGFYWSGAVRRFVTDSLEAAGLLRAAP